MKKWLLKAGLCLAGVFLTGAVAISTVDKLWIDPLKVDSLNALFERYINFREQWGPIVPPFVMYDDVADRMSKGDWSFLSENWYSKFDDGVLYVPEKSALAKGLKLPVRIQVREDMKTGGIYIFSAPLTNGMAGDFTGLAAFKAPEFMAYEKDFPLNQFLSDEFSPRRVVWEVTLKPEADAWSDLMFQSEEAVSSEQLEGGGMMRTMLVPEEHANEIWLGLESQTNGGMNLNVFAPEDFTNRIEIYSCSDLISNVWDIAFQNLYPAGTNPVTRDVSGNEVRFYAAGNMDIDRDGDGLPDAREKYVYKTDPTERDTDGDGMPDGWEIQYGLNPLLYADGGFDLDKDGRSNLEEYLAVSPPNNALPLEIGFESGELFANGNLNNQNYWAADAGVIVQSNHVFSGGQAMQLAAGAVSAQRELLTDAMIVTNEAVVFLSNCAGAPGSPPANSTSAVGYDPLRGFIAYDGITSEWVAVPGTTHFAEQWVRLKIVQNYGSKTWVLWIDGIEKLNGLGFHNSGASRLNALHIEKGEVGAAFIDEISFSGH